MMKFPHRLRHFEAAQMDAQQCLQLDDGHIKAAVRLAKASKALGLMSQAALPLSRILAKPGRLNGEIQEWYLEAETLRSCESCEAEDTTNSTSYQLQGVHKAALNLRQVSQTTKDAEELSLRYGRDSELEGDLLKASQALARELQRLEKLTAEDMTFCWWYAVRSLRSTIIHFLSK
eukprot:symbB.v1.2.040306.t1/scaffold7136.1/size13086/2